MKYRVTILRRPDYIHSRVFGHHAQVMAEALKDLGMYAEDGRPIVLGANICAMWPTWEHGVPDDAIIMQLEASDSPWLHNPAYIALLKTHAVLDYDASNVEWLRARGVDARHCPIRYHHCLTRLTMKPEAERDIDCLFYGSYMPRRTPILAAIEGQGYRCRWIGHDEWDATDDAITRSKIVLNVHAYDKSPLELARISYLWANRAFVMSEGPAIKQFDNMMVFVDDPVDFPNYIQAWLPIPDGRQGVADYGYARFSSMLQADELKKVLA